MSMPRQAVRSVDAVIVGGGIAGLWLLNVLRQRNYDVILLEASALGHGQTILSQGMIHGGLKYALGGRLSGASEALATMPARWRHCLNGSGTAAGDLDISGVPVLADGYHLWSGDRISGRLGSLLASKLLRARVERVHRTQFPAPFDAPAFHGDLYRLSDLVIDVPSLLRRLADPHVDRIWPCAVRPEDVRLNGDALVDAVVSDDAAPNLRPATLILAAGAGNEALLGALPDTAPQMQRRPLHQVVVRDAPYGPLYGHCVTNLTRAEPRLTVSSHRQRNGNWSWYLGGQLASDGVARDRDAQVAVARQELTACLPWLTLGDARFETVRVDRAEPQTAGGSRPDEAYIGRSGNALVCWPTKLSLVPDLADRLLAQMPAPGDVAGHDMTLTPDRERSAAGRTVGIAQAPWDE